MEKNLGASGIDQIHVMFDEHWLQRFCKEDDLTISVFILGFEKSGGSARKLWKNVGDFQKVWGIIR